MKTDRQAKRGTRAANFRVALSSPHVGVLGPLINVVSCDIHSADANARTRRAIHASCLGGGEQGAGSNQSQPGRRSDSGGGESDYGSWASSRPWESSRRG